MGCVKPSCHFHCNAPFSSLFLFVTFSLELTVGRDVPAVRGGEAEDGGEGRGGEGAAGEVRPAGHGPGAHSTFMAEQRVVVL